MRSTKWSGVPTSANGYPSGGYAGATGGQVVLAYFTATNANNPPNNLHFIRSDYPACPNTGALFGKEYLQAYDPFCCIRFMDWIRTNNSKVTNWASHPDPNVFGFNNNVGSCYENMIELCNQTSGGTGSGSGTGGSSISGGAGGPNPGNGHSPGSANNGSTGSSGSQSTHHHDLRSAGQMGGPIHGGG